jgi:23S rRNA pseudouridine2605 synthase
MRPNKQAAGGKWTGLARALSKLGLCSRSQGWQYILSGRVRLNGNVCCDPERRVDLQRDRIELDSRIVQAARKVYLMLNKPRGLITSTSDEHGRATVFTCFQGVELPPLSPVGRLDKASEGLLLFTNDTDWAAGITAPEAAIEKTYHVQIDRIVDSPLLSKLHGGVELEGQLLVAKRVSVLRQGSRNSWLEIVLTEGKNRHIRRMLEAFGVGVLRLVRVSVGPLQLGDLPKGQFRHLSSREVATLTRAKCSSKNKYPFEALS